MLSPVAGLWSNSGGQHIIRPPEAAWDPFRLSFHRRFLGSQSHRIPYTLECRGCFRNIVVDTQDCSVLGWRLWRYLGISCSVSRRPTVPFNRASVPPNAASRAESSKSLPQRTISKTPHSITERISNGGYGFYRLGDSDVRCVGRGWRCQGR